MVEANGAYKHGRYEQKLVETFTWKMSNFYVFAKLDGRIAGQTNKTHHTDPYIAYIDHKKREESKKKKKKKEKLSSQNQIQRSCSCPCLAQKQSQRLHSPDYESVVEAMCKA